MDNLVTSGAHKEVDGRPGALTMGIYNEGADTALVDNIVTHLADPDNPAEAGRKYWTHRSTTSAIPITTTRSSTTGSARLQASRGQDPSPDQNVAGSTPTLLDETTIQLFAAALLGNPNATIADLADYMRAIAEGTIDDELTADDILRLFPDESLRIEGERDGNATLRFTPDDRGDGVRWDNR
jgi:hypothetical protein